MLLGPRRVLTAAWFRPDLHPAGHLLISEEGYHVTSDLP